MSENKFTPRAEEALRLSQEAAEELGHGYVGSEHLLLGLIREEDGVRKYYHINLNDSKLLESPQFYLQQNDVVYVEPNAQQKRAATTNGNNVLSTGFWISCASLLTSVAVLIVSSVR